MKSQSKPSPAIPRKQEQEHNSYGVLIAAIKYFFNAHLREPLREFIRELLCEVLEEYLPVAIRKATQKERLTTAEVMQLTGWSKRQLQHKRDTGQIIFEQSGKTIWYPRAELDRFFDNCKVEKRR